MFNTLKKKFLNLFKNIYNLNKSKENEIEKSFFNIKKKLIDSDISIDIVNYLLKSVKKKIIENKFNDRKYLNLFIDELKNIINIKNNEDNLIVSKSNSICKYLFVGFKGSGKTTTLSKIAFYLKNKYKKKILTTSCDIYNPLSIDKLGYLCYKSKVDFFKVNNKQNILNILYSFLYYANINNYKFLLLDTFGCIPNNKKMINNIKKIQEIFKPTETFFIIDIMCGQNIFNICKNFYKLINITSFIVTKMDSNAKGGIILSIKYFLNKPIKFIGNGEKIFNLNKLNCNKIISNILGIKKIYYFFKNKKKCKKEKKKIKKEKFNFYIFLKYINKINDIKNNFLFKNIFSNENYFNEKFLCKIKNIINSMTIFERNNPSIIEYYRKKRISLGSGYTIDDVNNVLKIFYSFKKIKNMLKNKSKFDLLKNIKDYF